MDKILDRYNELQKKLSLLKVKATITILYAKGVFTKEKMDYWHKLIKIKE